LIHYPQQFASPHCIQSDLFVESTSLNFRQASRHFNASVRLAREKIWILIRSFSGRDQVLQGARKSGISMISAIRDHWNVVFTKTAGSVRKAGIAIIRSFVSTIPGSSMMWQSSRSSGAFSQPY